MRNRSAVRSTYLASDPRITCPSCSGSATISPREMRADVHRNITYAAARLLLPDRVPQLHRGLPFGCVLAGTASNLPGGQGGAHGAGTRVAPSLDQSGLVQTHQWGSLSDRAIARHAPSAVRVKNKMLHTAMGEGSARLVGMPDVT